MTEEQKRRIEKAVMETVALLNKEMAYSPDLRNEERIAFYDEHLARLEKMLAT